MPAPQRIAPWSSALSADVTVDDTDVATGRIILLHDPEGNDAWGGTFRCVAYARAEIEVDLVSDPLLAGVGWSWLTDALEAHVAERTSPKVEISDERDMLLETGGGMVKAQSRLADPFFCLNSDNIWLDGPVNAFTELSDFWDAERMDALLLVVTHKRAGNFNGPGDFHVDAMGGVTRRKPGRIAPFVYTGIQLVSHRLLRDAPEGKFSTNILWDRAIEEGRLFALPFNGEWFEVGTPAAIRTTEEALSRG